MYLFHTIAHLAGVAQLVERLTCNEDVVGSTPITGSNCAHSPRISRGATGVFFRIVATKSGGQQVRKNNALTAFIFFVIYVVIPVFMVDSLPVLKQNTRLDFRRGSRVAKGVRL